LGFREVLDVFGGKKLILSIENRNTIPELFSPEPSHYNYYTILTTLNYM